MSADVLRLLPPDVKTLKLNGHVGFDSLPDQLVNKAVSQGETGIGKSTLIETLFNQKFNFTASSHDNDEPTLKSNIFDLKEANVKLKLTVIETCGYGDQINKENNIKPVVAYIVDQFEAYLQEELKMKRSMHNYHDTRVHVCLYFITPSGHSLKSLDVIAMKQLENKVNVIPIIAKSDTITKAELMSFKARILHEIKSSSIGIYQFPTDDEAVAEVNKSMNQHVPFAIVGSSEEVKLNGKLTRVRQYPWGSVQVENEAHCDFVRLREMMLRVNMEDLRERTHTVHYETFRKQRLIEMGYRDDEKMSLQETYETRRETQKKELQQKEEEMRQTFVARVREKEQVLKEAERELQNKLENLKKTHAEEKKKLEEKKRILDEEIALFEKRKELAEQAKHGNLTLKKKK